MLTTIPIQEIFPSIEGEGDAVGLPTVFIRVAGCDFKCSWCDTKESWDTIGKDMEIADVVSRVKQILNIYPNIHRLSITGGNPFLYHFKIMEIMEKILRDSNQVIMFNLEHPGTHYDMTDPQYNRQDEALTYLDKHWYRIINDYEKWGARLTINMDVKLPMAFLEEGVQMLLKAHSNLVAGKQRIGFVVKFVISHSKELEALRKNFLSWWYPYEQDVETKFFIGLVRYKDNTVNNLLRDEVIRVMMEEPMFKGWRLNPNLHIQLGIK